MIRVGSEVVVLPTLAAFYEEAAKRVARQLTHAVAARGAATLAVSGGATPGPLYALLASDQYARRIPWERVHILWCDERCVPRQDARSNYAGVAELLLARVPIPPENVHAVPVGDANAADADSAARAYEAELRGCTALAGDGAPQLDAVVLGVGEDGHTASLFPGSAALDERQNWVAAVPAGAAPFVERVTLTPVILDGAALALVLVAGAGKAAIVRRIHTGGGEASDKPGLPAERLAPRGALVWLLDESAASALPSS